SALAFVRATNSAMRFPPYRLADRADQRFNVSSGVPYYRLTELFIPEAKSQFYVGRGAQVGMSTITGLACLARLLDMRDDGLLAFGIWPFEDIPARHLVVEVYPALFPKIPTEVLMNDHQRDAMRTVRWLHDNVSDATRLRLPTIPGLDGQFVKQRAN